jgi:NAD(P)-dependent dehydrogenase (short-subunit alcohol dehydrogenase family)
MRPYGPERVKKLTGRVALVTGGAVRVGRAIALALARDGADVAIGYLRSTAEATRTVREIEALGVRAVAFRADLAKPDEARRLVTRAVRQLGRLDLLVNNAAIFFRTPFLTTTPAQFDRVIAVNLRAAFFCAQAAARVMGRRGGRIVNIADVGAVRAWPGYVPYGVSKAGVAMLTKGLAAALAPAAFAAAATLPAPLPWTASGSPAKAPTRLTTASAPATTLARLAGLVTSQRINCTSPRLPRVFARKARSGWRLAMRRRAPRESSSCARCLPKKPLPP